MISEATQRGGEKRLERPDLYVIARFLEILRKNGPTKKTNVHMLLGLNYPRFTGYHEWMEEHELVTGVTLRGRGG